MSKRLTVAVLAGFVLLIAASAKAPAQTSSPPKSSAPLTPPRDTGSAPRRDDVETQVDRLIQPLIDKHVVVGMSIGLVDRGTTYLFNYGSTSPKKSEKPTDATLYEIGSITKTFTATLLADAVERKQMQLDDPIQNYLPQSVKMPEFRNTPITLLHIMTHRSGLPRVPNNVNPKDPQNPFVDYDEERLYAFLSSYKLKRMPGEKFEYSNLAVGLLGCALARQAGLSYEALLRNRILEPLGMSQTAIDLTPDARAHLAEGSNADCEAVSNWDLNALQGAGGIRSSVHDMLVFLQANMNPKGLPLEQAMLLAQKPEASILPSGNIGLAWHILPGGHVIWHNGRTGGYVSILAFNRAKERGVVLLCNTATSGVAVRGFDLLKILDGVAPKTNDARTEATVDPMLLDR